MDLECQDPQKLEKHIHTILAEQQFIPNHKVEGGTEMFVELNELRVIHYLKAYVRSSYVDPPTLTKEDCKKLCQLMTR
jgi:Mlc titration factor MtfA (ptsG expression regulator)